MQEIKMVKLNTIKKNPKNPRIVKDDGFKKLKDSLSGTRGLDHFYARPCIVSTRTGEHIIIAGNTRYQAAKDLGWKEVPVVILTDLTEEQEKEIIIRDNVSNGEWDWDMLSIQYDLEELQHFGVNMFEAEELDDEQKEEYSQKIGTVTYEPKNTNHTVRDLIDTEKKDSLCKKITDSNLPEELKGFLMTRAHFFVKFNFSNIADFYAYQATAEEKILFEELALVLLDKNQLMANGFSKLLEEI